MLTQAAGPKLPKGRLILCRRGHFEIVIFSADFQSDILRISEKKPFFKEIYHTVNRQQYFFKYINHIFKYFIKFSMYILKVSSILDHNNINLIEKNHIFGTKMAIFSKERNSTINAKCVINYPLEAI